MSLPIRNSRIRLSQGQLFWREVGQGKTIVFLHDAFSDGEEWLPVVDYLSRANHALVPDLLGFGESDRPKTNYSIELMVECLSELLETLRQRQVWLVGNGVGGWIAATYALRYPHNVEGIVLLTPKGFALSGADRYSLDRLLNFPLVEPLLYLLLPIFRLFKKQRLIKGWLYRSAQLRRSPASCRLLFRRRQRELQAEQMNQQISQLKLPMLVLCGSEDDAGAIAQSQSYAQAPQAELKMISGDALLQTAPDHIAELILGFVR